MELLDVWPLHGLRLRTPDLELRPATEADLPRLCAVLPPDLEADPAATRYPGLDDRSNHRVILAQSYWRAMGTWTPQNWVLPFAVRRDGELIGMQALEGPNWTVERTVDSWSWLVDGARGLGLGKQMRAAVLELAFTHLGAAAAVSSAGVDNAGSLGVSHSLGYADTHQTVLSHNNETLQHVRLEAAAWVSSGAGAVVQIEGVAPTLPFFGVGEGGA